MARFGMKCRLLMTRSGVGSRMDPSVCLSRIQDALDDGDQFEAFTAAADLHEWLTRGGFEPDWSRAPGARDYYWRLSSHSKGRERYNV